jgi:hypothetical protein
MAVQPLLRHVGRPLLGADGHAWGWGTSEKTFRAEVFVNVGPVDPIPGPDDLPVHPLGRGCLQEPRIPHEWNRDRAAVSQVHAQGVVREMNAPDRLARLKLRSSHSKAFGNPELFSAISFSIARSSCALKPRFLPGSSLGSPLNARPFGRSEYCFWVSRHDSQEDSGAAFGLPPALLPVAQGGRTDAHESREL